LLSQENKGPKSYIGQKHTTFRKKSRFRYLSRLTSFSLHRTSDRITEDDDSVERLQSYKSWKGVILLYELAQTLSLFHTIVFWVFFYDNMYDYYYYIKQPDTQINRDMRVIIMWLINSIPPAIMIFDMIFNKIVFRLRHFWVGLVSSVIFLVIQFLGKEVLLKSKSHAYMFRWRISIKSGKLS